MVTKKSKSKATRKRHQLDINHSSRHPKVTITGDDKQMVQDFGQRLYPDADFQSNPDDPDNLLMMLGSGDDASPIGSLNTNNVPDNWLDSDVDPALDDLGDISTQKAA